LPAASVEPGHLGGRPGLVDEDEPVRLPAHSRLSMVDPLLARLADVRAILFAGQQGFF
jgi:hypothetical protein